MWLNVICAKLNLRQCCQQWFAAARCGGSHLWALLQGPLYCISATFLFVVCLPCLPQLAAFLLHPFLSSSRDFGKYVDWKVFPLIYQCDCASGCHSQGHHGYLHSQLASHLAPPDPRHLPQAHLLVMSITWQMKLQVNINPMNNVN